MTTTNNKPSTYTARWVTSGKIVYKSQPHGNLFGLLPLGSMPFKFPGGNREDEWDGAVFKCDGEAISVLRDLD